MRWGRKFTPAVALPRCPFYDGLAGCEFQDISSECDYNKGKSPPEDCPMATGSVTLIYYIDKE